MIVGLADAPDASPMIEEIFFLSSSVQTFDTDDARQRFLEAWTGYYRESEPDGILLYLAPDGRVAGYLTGCRDSRAATRLYADIDSYRVFEDQFDAYPAHFHVNCHPDHRNHGNGSRLVAAFLDDCRGRGVAGVHVVTAEGARNIGFYRRCGFETIARRRWRDRDLVCLGRAP